MSNIRIDYQSTIIDGTEITFKAPCDCTAITGLKVYYPDSSGTQTSKVFTLVDSHKVNIGNLSDLFVQDAIVKVVLDVTNSKAFVENADNNSFINAQLSGKANTSHTHTKSQITDFPSSMPASDVYSWAKASSKPSYTPSEVGLGNVGNFKAVSTVASQGLSDTEKSNARANIGAGTSSFSGNYNDLSNKPTIPTVNNATLTIQKNGTSVGTFTANASSNSTVNITVPTKTSELTNNSGFLTSHQDITGKVDKASGSPSYFKLGKDSTGVFIELAD